MKTYSTCDIRFFGNNGSEWCSWEDASDIEKENANLRAEVERLREAIGGISQWFQSDACGCLEDFIHQHTDEDFCLCSGKIKDGVCSNESEEEHDVCVVSLAKKALAETETE